MDQIIVLWIVICLLTLFVFFMKFHKKHYGSGGGRDVSQIKLPNKRDNFRLRIDIEDVLMEVTKIGDQVRRDSEICEIIDISASGMGLYSDKDLPLRQKVLVKLFFKLNYREFSFDGVLVRKIELSNKQKIQYGVKFINLSEGDENRLLKEIAAIDNSRRKISIR